MDRRYRIDVAGTFTGYSWSCTCGAASQDPLASAPAAWRAAREHTHLAEVAAAEA